MSVVVGAAPVKPEKAKTDPAKVEFVKDEAEEKPAKKRTRKG